MRRWLTADTHFFHDNIIRYCRRPFANVGAMNACIAENWNAVVGDDDEVWHLGDFALSDRTYETQELFDELRGKKYLVKGNHDKGFVLKLGWENVYYPMGHVIGGVRLTHNGTEYLRNHPGSDKVPIFCANVHDIWKMQANKLNVGVDVWHFRPVAWEDAVSYWHDRFEYFLAHGRDA